MRLQIIGVGRLKDGPERSLTDDYLARTQPLARQLGLLVGHVRLHEVAERRHGSDRGRQPVAPRRPAAAAPPRRGAGVEEQFAPAPDCIAVRPVGNAVVGSGSIDDQLWVKALSQAISVRS